MDITKILEYQKKDFEKVKLERELENDKSKQEIEKMVQLVKQSQSKSSSLEEIAGSLLKEFNSLRKNYDENVNSLNLLKKKDMSKMNENDIISLTNLCDTISSNLSILEKKILACAEKINSSLYEFEQAKKRYMLARESHQKHKAIYEKKLAELQPKISKVDAELLALEKTIDKAVLDKYKQKRMEKIFPILVPLSDKSCGGCFTELPIAKQSKLKDSKILECEHCRRIIYIK